MLFGDADVEGAMRKFFFEESTPVPAGMAAVMATIRSSPRASSIRLSPKTRV